MKRYWTVFLPLFGALAWWPLQIDDQFISLAYSRALVESGQLNWGAAAGWEGERVEGFSNLLWVLLFGPVVALGLDPDLVARGFALLSAMGIVYLATRLGGCWLGVALGLWVPLSWWSAGGMETTLYGLLLCLGWWRVFEKDPYGLWVLLLAALARLEGSFQLIAGCMVLGFIAHTSWKSIGGALSTFAGYQFLRVLYFGELLPTPFLVKVQENPFELDTLWQWLQELASCIGVAGVLLLSRSPATPLVLIPFLIQSGVELVADTDWMGHGRLLLPGVAASACAWAVSTEPRVLSHWQAALISVLVLVGSLLDPPGMGKPALSLRPVDTYLHPLHTLSLPLDSPGFEDIRWLIRNVPDGAMVFTGDVGMVGNLPGIRVVDLNGLTNRKIALFNLGKTESVERPLSLCYLRQSVRPDGVGLGLEGWMGENWWELAAWSLDELKIRWLWCGEGSAPKLPIEKTLERWKKMIDLHPSQGALWRAYAEDLVRAEKQEDALRLASQIVDRWPLDLRGWELRRKLSFSKSSTGFVSIPLKKLSVKIGVKLKKPARLRTRWDCDREWVGTEVSKETVLELPDNQCGGERVLVQVEGLAEAEIWLAL